MKNLIISFLLATPSLLYGQTNDKSPNIVLILADDLALMDLGIYGGEALTPNLDRLARQGTIFTNYHSSPSCAPSRAMLMTGCDSHLTGVPNLPLFLPSDQVKQPGYEGVLNNKVKTIATRLKEKGYQNYISGKWHLGHTATTLPTKRGFDRSFILDASGADNYEHKAYLPAQSKPVWVEDGKRIDLPENFYSSRNLVDKLISFMSEEQNKEAPFFAYLSFQALHIPVQAPKEFSEKYESVYMQGWDKIREQRFKKAKKLGLIQEDAILGDMLSPFKKWDSLSEEDKKLRAKAMSVNAGMLEAMDFHIGRYISYLERRGLLENTTFIFTSDNGPEGSDPSLLPGFSLWLKAVGYHTDYERLGEKGSWNFIGPEYASAAASPNAFFKFYAGEGGLRVPLIFSGKNIPIAQKKKAFTFVSDVCPTILSMVGDDSNEDEVKMTGRSLYPLIQNEDSLAYSTTDVIGLEAAGNSALFRGEMKITRNGIPYGDAKWRLYNIKNDPGETKDLSSIQPDLFDELLLEYSNYAKKFKVLEMSADYNMFQEVQNKSVTKFYNKGLPYLVGISIFTVFLIIRKRKKGLKS